VWDNGIWSIKVDFTIKISAVYNKDNQQEEEGCQSDSEPLVFEHVGICHLELPKDPNEERHVKKEGDQVES
jgi:hypothetical protein